MYTRREFAQLALAAAPLAVARNAGAASDTALSGVPIGVSTFSFRDLPRTPGRDNIRPVIAALEAAGVSRIELSSADVESPAPIDGLPKPQTGGAYGGMTVQLTPQELAAVKRANRDNLRQWRLAAKPALFEAIRAQFDAAGISVFSYRIDFDNDFTDSEIEAIFAQAKALGVRTIGAAATLDVARRLAPFAEHHAATLAFQNAGGNAISSPADFSRVLALSKNFCINLDIGNFTASNFAAVAFIQENHASISHITIKDRTRGGGGNEEFGNGDTPIKPVLSLLKEKQYRIPVFVLYEYLGMGTPGQEVRKCMDYVRAALT